MIKYEDLQKKLRPTLDEQTKMRFSLAFRSLEYQDNYCRFHYEQFLKELDTFKKSLHGEFQEIDTKFPQYYRVAFEAHGFAFFRALHSLIESIPYLLNIFLDVDEDSENRHISWNSIVKYCESNVSHSKPHDSINSLRASRSYIELQHLVNVTKHRRIPRIDSGIFNLSSGPKFCPEDLDEHFRSYNIEILMNTLFDELHPKALEVIKNFIEIDETALRLGGCSKTNSPN